MPGKQGSSHKVKNAKPRPQGFEPRPHARKKRSGHAETFIAGLEEDRRQARKLLSQQTKVERKRVEVSALNHYMRLLPVMCSSAPSADTTLQKALESFYEAFISDDPRDGQSRFGYALWRATEMLTVPQAKYFTAKAKHHVAADQMPVAS